MVCLVSHAQGISAAAHRATHDADARFTVLERNFKRKIQDMAQPNAKNQNVKQMTQAPTRKRGEPKDPNAEAPVRVDTRVHYVESDEAKAGTAIRDGKQVPLVNADGKLVGVPVGYDYAKHKAPKRGDFYDEADFYEWKSTVYASQAQRLAKRSESLLENSRQMRKFADPAQRALVKRRVRLAEQMAELDAQLEADGVDVEALDADSD